MRRLLAILQLFIAISLSLVTPLLRAGVQKELPACCRRDGNHHCARQSSQPVDAGTHIGNSSQCPLFPVGHTAPAPAPHGTVALTAGDGTTVALVAAHVPPQTVANHNNGSVRTRCERGPPSSFVS